VRRIRELFDLIWPMVLAMTGTAGLLVLLFVPSLRDPEVFAALGGLLTGGSLLGRSQGRRRRLEEWEE
jgi:hypothetical protein